VLCCWSVELEICLVQDAGSCEGLPVWCVGLDGTCETLRPVLA